MITFGLGIPAGKLVVPSASMSARSSSSGLSSGVNVNPDPPRLCDVVFGRFLVQFSLDGVHGKVHVVPGGFVLGDKTLLSCAIVRRKMAALDFRRTVLASS